MRQFLIVGLIIIGAPFLSGRPNDYSALAQGACTLKAAQAPAIGGIRLGMTQAQLLALFPGSRDDQELSASLARPASKFGTSNFVIKPQKYASKAKFAGVNQITFIMLDGRVSSFNADYNGPEYKHVDQFVAKFSEGTVLPAPDAWEANVGMDTQLKTLKCKDFEVSVFAGGKLVHNINYVKVRDLTAEAEIKARRAKARENEVKQTVPGSSVLP
jgi:hypothetical protein